MSLRAARREASEQLSGCWTATVVPLACAVKRPLSPSPTEELQCQAQSLRAARRDIRRPRRRAAPLFGRSCLVAYERGLVWRRSGGVPTGPSASRLRGAGPRVGVDSARRSVNVRLKALFWLFGSPAPWTHVRREEGVHLADRPREHLECAQRCSRSTCSRESKTKRSSIRVALLGELHPHRGGHSGGRSSSRKDGMS
jgi:hypothetical protein